MIKSYQAKVSNLNITSDDICMILAKCNKTLINISLNYLSKTPYRQILIETNNNTYHLDLITNMLKIVDQDGKERYAFDNTEPFNVKIKYKAKKK